MWNPPPPALIEVTRRQDSPSTHNKNTRSSPRSRGQNAYFDSSPWNRRISNDFGFPSEIDNSPLGVQNNYTSHPTVDNDVGTNNGHPNGPIDSTYNINGDSSGFNPTNGDMDAYNDYAPPRHTLPTRHVPNALSSAVPHPKLEKVGPYLMIATLQAYTILTVVRCLADPIWIVLRSNDKGTEDTRLAEIGSMEKAFLACAIAFTMLSCLGVTLRIMDKLLWLRRIPVITAYLEALFCTAALVSFLNTHTPLPPGGQFSHGFLACVITVVFSLVVAIMLTVDWWRGFPSAGLSATLKALIISSFVMTSVIIIGAAIYSSLENWTFDDAVNFCIVSFATIGYGNLSPKTHAGQIIFFFYGLLGISTLGFFVVSLRNAVIEQFQWRLIERFSKPAHLTRVQTRMSAKDISFPMARLEEEEMVKRLVKRKMIVRMIGIWVVMWFGGAGVFCAFEPWTFLESLYFCFVTLTTIGFGDYVPEQPGSIEFWNVYVFVGLSVFAYILSLSSESMATHIHLVDDQDEDDDADMYGWERNEDPNAPFTTRSGILGLEGLKWLQHQQQHQQQQPQQIPVGQDLDGISDLEGKYSNGAMMNNSSGSLDIDQSEGSINIPRSRSKRKNSSGRILTVTSKERKQMLQAEYYAAHSLPSTVRFVDTRGVPHQRVISRGFTISETPSGAGPSNGGGNGYDNQPFNNRLEHAMTHYGTVGYMGTIGRGGIDNLKRVDSGLRSRLNARGVGVAQHGTMYGAGSLPISNIVQTNRLQHQPLIKFDSPKGSAGNTHTNAGRATESSRRPGGPDYIPSCIDVFRNGKLEQQRSRQLANGEGSSLQHRFARPVMGRTRSSSWDSTAASNVAGPSQTDVHRWLAEDAGVLPGPNLRLGSNGKNMGQSDSTFATSSLLRPSPSTADTTRVSSPDINSPDPSSSPYQSPSIKEKSSLLGHASRPSISMFTTEPTQMTDDEEERFHARQSDVQNYHRFTPLSANSLSSSSSSRPSGVTAVPSLELVMPTPPSSREPTIPPPSPSQGLFMGGGPGANYGPHAYGVLFSGSKPSSIFDGDSGSEDEATSSMRPSGTTLPGPRLGLSTNVPDLAPNRGQQQQQQQPSQQRPRSASPPLPSMPSSISPPLHSSTFLSGPPPGSSGSQSSLQQQVQQHFNRQQSRSGQSSAAASPTGSRSNSRAPSVLMSIFDDPHLGSNPPSRNVSRTNSLTQSQIQSLGSNPMFSRQGSSSGGVIPQPPSPPSSSSTSAAALPPLPPPTSLSSSGGVAVTASGTRSGSSDDSTLSRRSSGQNAAGSSSMTNLMYPAPRMSTDQEDEIGPFDERRDPGEIAHFDDDVDLNHAGLHPEQVAEARKRREDLWRRERELEVRLARLGAKGRGVQQDP